MLKNKIIENQSFEEILIESQLNFRTLINTMPQLIWTAKPDGYANYFNQSLCKYIGITLEENQGWGWSNFLHSDDRQRCLDAWNESLSTGKEYKIECRFRCSSDDKYRWFLNNAVAIRNDMGNIVEWIGTITNIDDQKRTIEGLQDSLQQAQLARKEAEAENRLKDEFLAVLSHELRILLNPVLGWIQTLQTEELDSITTVEALDVVERNVKKQVKLIEDLFDISRIMRSKLILDTSWVDLESVIMAALDTVSFTARRKKIEIKCYISELNHIGFVMGDADRLQQVVWNLMSNAIKFTPKGGQVKVSLESVGRTARITVSDTGEGIDSDFLPHIFKCFYQEDASVSRNFGGMGLGLAIARSIVEIHGGTIKASSPGKGQGSTFTVSLPLTTSDKIVLDESEPEEISKDLSGIKVLVVDDNADSRDFVTFDLQLHGAEVIAVSSASEAFQVLASAKPDVLVSDIGMPQMCGYEMLIQLRASKSENGSEIPAIAVTAYAGERERQKALAVGFQMHLSKPLEAGAISTAVAQLISQNS